MGLCVPMQKPVVLMRLHSIKFPSSNDSFVQARATSISAGVSGAIFRFAAQLPGGVQDKFDNGFKSITEKVFVCSILPSFGQG